VSFSWTYDGSFVKIVLNGVVVGTPLNTTIPPAKSGSGINICRRWDNTDFLKANVSIIRIYDRALDSSEILNNFNEERSRFGI
jgi:hypothetical protein